VREFVGVKNPADINTATEFKQYALLFSRIAVVGLRHIKTGRVATELAWLQENGIVFEPPHIDITLLRNNPEILHYLKLEKEQLSALSKQVLTAVKSDELLDSQSLLSQASDVSNLLRFMMNTTVRTVSVELRELYQIEAYPLLSDDRLFSLESQSKKTSVIQLAVKSLPILDESVPWEQVIEYRSNPDSRSKFLALRHWMSEVARSELTPAEVEEKLEYLIDQYRKHMRLHRMKTNAGTLETVVTTGAEFLGDLVSFKWGKAAEALFSLRRRRVALLEGELTAPGNEVAYIVKVREIFS
jgi:hypothetical protein